MFYGHNALCVCILAWGSFFYLRTWKFISVNNRKHWGKTVNCCTCTSIVLNCTNQAYYLIWAFNVILPDFCAYPVTGCKPKVYKPDCETCWSECALCTWSQKCTVTEWMTKVVQKCFLCCIQSVYCFASPEHFYQN